MRGRGGSTLIEMLIACGLFLLAMVVIGQLTVRAMTSHNQTVDKNQVFRAATIVLDHLQRDLEHTQAIYSPYSSSDLTGIYHPGAADATLVLKTQGTLSPVVGYRFDTASNTLVRLLYEPGYDPAVLASQVPLASENPRKVNSIQSFSVDFIPRSQSYGTLMVRTVVAVQTGTGPSLNLSSQTRLMKL